MHRVALPGAQRLPVPEGTDTIELFTDQITGNIRLPVLGFGQQQRQRLDRR